MAGDGLELLSSTELASASTTTAESLASCTRPDCLREIASGADLHGLVRSTVQVSLNMYVLRIEVFGTDGQPIASTDERCDLCTLAEAGSTLGQAAAALGEELPRGGTLRLDVTPASASIRIDDENVSGSELVLSPGRHDVDVSAEGYISQRRSMDIGLGGEVTLALILEREGTGVVPETGLSEGLGSMGISGVVLVASGGLALAAGIALLVIDDSCAGGRTDANGQCEFIYSTLGGGAALASIGGVALITGVVLIVLDRLRRREAVPSEPRSSFAPVMGGGLDGHQWFGGTWRLSF